LRRHYNFEAPIGLSTKAGHSVRCRTKIDSDRTRGADWTEQASWMTMSEKKAGAHQLGRRKNPMFMQATAIQIPVFRRYDLIALARSTLESRVIT
jgi:hypothetical protein